MNVPEPKFNIDDLVVEHYSGRICRITNLRYDVNWGEWHYHIRPFAITKEDGKKIRLSVDHEIEGEWEKTDKWLHPFPQELVDLLQTKVKADIIEPIE